MHLASNCIAPSLAQDDRIGLAVGRLASKPEIGHLIWSYTIIHE